MTDQKMIFLTDQPVTEDELGAHANIAELLVKALLSDGVDAASKSPIVLGLFGSWGTGKSSIIQMFNKEIKEKHLEASNVVFDAWAFSNAKERFGPNLLIALAEDLLDEVEAGKIRKEIDRREETVETTPKLSSMGQLLFVLLMLVIIGLLVVSQSADSPQATITGLLISSVLLTGILNWFLPRHISNFIKTTTNVSFNEIDHFRRCFNQIVRSTKTQRISIVIDNLDRVEAEDALEMMRMVKSFVVEDDNLKSHNKKLLFIVPVDDKELARHLKNAKHLENSYDFLNKFINLVLYVPSIVHQNIIGYTKKQFDKVAQGLEPALDQEEADAVSFILAKAARKSPRQVKILVNSFVLFWNSMGLSVKNRRSTVVSPMASAVFVGYRFLMQEKLLNPRVSELLAPIENTETLTTEALDFITRVQEFVTTISPREWLQLVQLQTSEGERSRANFIEMYDLVLDSRFQEADALASDEPNLAELLSNLFRQADEDGALARTRVCKWTLIKLGQKSIALNQIPYAIKATIKSRIELRGDAWSQLIGSGLAELIFATQLSTSLHKNVLDFMLDTNNMKHDDLIDASAQFLVEIVKANEFLELPPDLQGRYETAILSFLEQSLIAGQGALQQVSKFQNKELGAGLAVWLDKRIGRPTFELPEPSFVRPGGDAVLSFSKRFLELPESKASPDATNYWATVCHQIFLTFGNDDSLADLLPGEERLNEVISQLGALSNPASELDNKSRIRAAETLLLLDEILEQINREQNRLNCENILSQQVLPQIIDNLDNATGEERKELFSFIDSHRNSLKRFPSSQIVRLLKYEEFPLVPVLKETEDNRIEKILGGLLKETYWVDFLSRWLSSANESEEKEDALKLVLAALETDSYKQEKYSESLKPFAQVGRSPSILTSVNQHALNLIDRIDWTAPDNSTKVGELVDNLRELERIGKLDKQVLEKIRTNLSIAGGSINETFLSLLPEETQEWLINHLVVTRAK